MKRGAHLGTWQTPTGNSCDCFLRGRGELAFEWDRFPLSAADELYYRLAILPDVTRRAGEYLEITGRALVVMA